MDKFELKLWNGQYYARARFPDGTTAEIKSADDLTYAQWKEKIEKAWDDHQTPPIEPPTDKECQCPLCKGNFVCPNRKTNVIGIP